MEDKDIIKLRKKYYEAIVLLEDKEDILNALPKPEYPNFFLIIENLINHIETEIIELENLLKEKLDEQLKKEIEFEIKTLLRKKRICIELKERATQEEKQEEESKNVPKNIVFATTNSGNVCIKNDIKNFPEEYYEDIIYLLEKIRLGIEEDNNEKAKKMRTVNKKMNGIHEVKGFKVRIFYKRLSTDTVYVFMAKMKKSNNDRLERTSVIERMTQLRNQYEKLKKKITIQSEKEKIISTNETILTDIYNFLNKNKRGK